jgi:hypothetical protein
LDKNVAKMGRPTNRVKHLFDEILDSPSGIQKFKKIMAATTKEETYLSYFKECVDRSSVGKSVQVNENFNHDETERPSKEQLDAALRSIDAHKNGNGVAQGQ